MKSINLKDFFFADNINIPLMLSFNVFNVILLILFLNFKSVQFPK